jgi:hypothetical protein
MWIVRELSRLLLQIAVAVAIAAAVAGIKAAASGGGMLHTWRITLFALAGLMLLLATAGRGGANRRLNAGFDHGSTFVMRFPRAARRPEDPTLTASAVFVGSGAVLLVLGFLV